MKLFDNVKKLFNFSSKHNSYVGSDLTDDEITVILDCVVEDLFPESGEWNDMCLKPSSEMREDCMPSHLRDIGWLARFIIQNRTPGIPYSKVYDYVQNSELFDEARRAYEQRIVQWQINHIMNGGLKWICDDKYGKDYFDTKTNCDEIFRTGVKKTLLAIGLDEEAIEQGLEENADLWREKYMQQAFYNRYNKFFACYKSSDNKDEHNKVIRMRETEQQHEDLWIKLRKYAYFLNHKDSVVKYGKVEPCMLMSSEETEQNRITLVKMNTARKQYIETFFSYGMLNCEESVM